MKSWVKIIAVTLPVATAAVLLLLLLLLICRRFRHRKLLPLTMVNPHTADSLSEAETHRHHLQAHEEDSPVNRRDSDLAAEVAEQGWSLFTFGHCTLCKTSSAFMQTVRLNPAASHGDDGSICSTRMRFPLPGPPSDRFSFPQVTYFEITILYLNLRQPKQAPTPQGPGKRATAGSAHEDDRTKLIDVNSIEIAAVHQKPIKREEGERKRLGLCLGLTRGDPSTDQWPPGIYPGSIGFQANGSIFLDGTKLVPESAKTGWGAANKVIGCGFDPSKKKVFFTVDSELVHVVRCASDAYGAPLFPAIAADTDVMLVVNMGQKKFKYESANAYRTPNPCSIVYEEKQVMFADDDRMKSERLSSGKEEQSGRKKNMEKCEGERVEFEADSDLFEISLN